MRNIALAAVIMAVFVAGAFAQEGDEAKLIKELRGEGEIRQRSGEELERDYLTVIKALARKLGGTENYAKGEAATALDAISNQATRPGAHQERAALCKAMAQVAKEEKAQLARTWLLRQIERLGRDEVVATLAELMGDDDELVRQHALLALANNPSEAAGEKLRGVLESSDDSHARVAIINALGYRRDSKSVAVLAKWTEDFDERVATAAVVALGATGTPVAFEALSNVDEEAKVSAGVLLNEWLRCFEKLPPQKQSQALGQFGEQLKTPAQWKLALLRAVVMSPEGGKAAELLVDSLIGADVQLQMTAAHLAAAADADLAKKVFNAFDSYPPTAQAALLAAYGERQIPGTKEKALASISSEDAAVRRAALAALGAVGDAGTAVMLAKTAAERSGAEQTAARESIARIRGADVDDALMQALAAGDGKVKAELIRALAARRATAALPTLEQLARNDGDVSVRVEAINAMGALAPAKSLPTVLDILQKAKEQRETQAAESAAAAILAKIDNAGDRAGPVLAVLPNTTGEKRMAMLRLLGRTGSRDALEELRKELARGEPQMRSATVRALSEWPDAAVVPDLLTIAQQDQNNTNKVLALRGYVRVVALPSDRRASETARMLGEALKLAPANEKKAVLGALGAVNSPEALRLTAPLMEQEAVRNEAITASLRIARAVAGAVPDEATAAAKRALELAPQDEAVKRNAQAALNAAERSRDFVTQWLVAGPFMEEGKDKDAVFDIAFGPEKGEAANWKKMPANPDRSRFWEMNLEQVSDLRGENRAAYLKTQIILPKAQELQLEVGSDDAIKVWVNGQLVHANNASRGNEPGQDKVKVKMNEGSNVVLMKVVNGGGGWGANARLRTLDDKKVAGMRVRAE